MQRKIFFFIGTTAELIKLAPVIREFKKRMIDIKIISSGQNTLAFKELDFLLGKQTANYTLKTKPIYLPFFYFRFLVWMLKAFINFILYFRSQLNNNSRIESIFIVHGDTISSLLGALIAKFNGFRLVHIESGLRSFNAFEPFPEEICRFLVSQLADIHFCPNTWAFNNLKKNRGIKINTYNNTLLESALLTLEKTKSKIVKPLLNQRYFILVMHRQEHILFKKNSMKKMLKIFMKYTNENFKMIFVLHKLTEKFLVSQNLLKELKKNKNIILIPRLPYKDFLHLIKNGEFVATDGGSNQEECFYLGKPCIILRGVYERIEGLGSNALLSYNDEKKVVDFILNYKKYRQKPIKITTPPSKIIVDYLTKH